MLKIYLFNGKFKIQKGRLIQYSEKFSDLAQYIDKTDLVKIRTSSLIRDKFCHEVIPVLIEKQITKLSIYVNTDIDFLHRLSPLIKTVTQLSINLKYRCRSRYIRNIIQNSNLKKLDISLKDHYYTYSNKLYEALKNNWSILEFTSNCELEDLYSYRNRKNLEVYRQSLLLLHLARKYDSNSILYQIPKDMINLIIQKVLSAKKIPHLVDPNLREPFSYTYITYVSYFAIGVILLSGVFYSMIDKC